MPTEPHYLRVARALALVGGLSATSAGCGESRVLEDAGAPDGGAPALDGSSPSADASTDAGGADGGAPMDAGADLDGATVVADAGDVDAGTTLADAGDVDASAVPFDCASCDCFGAPDVDAGVPSCFPDHGMCCIAIGPLPPPDLAV